MNERKVNESFMKNQIINYNDWFDAQAQVSKIKVLSML